MKNFLFFLCWFFSVHVLASADTVSYLTFRDTISLSVENNEKFFLHKIKKGQTLFSLARFYGMHYQELQYYNPGLAEVLALDQTVRIPIPNKAIIRYLPAGSPRWAYAPVLYAVKKGDTVFRISQYFKMPTDTVTARGKVLNNSLKPGMLIPVGWLSTKGIPENYRPEPAHPLLKKNLPLRRQFEASTARKKTLSTQGPAFWQKGSFGRLQFLRSLRRRSSPIGHRNHQPDESGKNLRGGLRPHPSNGVQSEYRRSAFQRRCQNAGRPGPSVLC
ncbi:MAG: LysM peptidoglycan-binding domain-containing protein [Haliscomenobacter sp.]|nr:LysM peptidoglycan-binding domain-containing protein [Haliscomenobacter sp.]